MLRAVAENVAHLRAHVGEPGVAAHFPHDIVHVLDGVAQLFLSLPQRLFRLLAGGDVPDDAPVTLESALPVVDDDRVGFHDELVTVPVQNVGLLQAVGLGLAEKPP